MQSCEPLAVRFTESRMLSVLGHRLGPELQSFNHATVAHLVPPSAYAPMLPLLETSYDSLAI